MMRDTHARAHTSLLPDTSPNRRHAHNPGSYGGQQSSNTRCMTLLIPLLLLRSAAASRSLLLLLAHRPSTPHRFRH